MYPPPTDTKGTVPVGSAFWVAATNGIAYSLGNVGIKTVDPQGSKAKAYYSKQKINGKYYNLKVIYNRQSNTIYHYHYQSKPIINNGNVLLPKPQK